MKKTLNSLNPIPLKYSKVIGSIIPHFPLRAVTTRLFLSTYQLINYDLPKIEF